MSKKGNDKKQTGNDFTKVMLIAMGLLVVLIIYLGINIAIKSSEANSIDKEIDKITEQYKSK